MTEWIDVKNNLPPLNQRVYIWNGEEQFVGWREEHGWEYSCCGCYCGDITHWMPLQNPPEPWYENYLCQNKLKF